MSNSKKEKIIHVDKLVIHAKEVQIIEEQEVVASEERRNPWDFFWNGSRRAVDNKEE